MQKEHCGEKLQWIPNGGNGFYRCKKCKEKFPMQKPTGGMTEEEIREFDDGYIILTY